MTPLQIWLLRAGLFLAALIATCVYAGAKGGAPERWVAAMFFVAAFATALLPWQAFVKVPTPLFAIDVALLLGVIGIALAADRFWPLYVAAVQLMTVAIHGVRAYDASILPVVYARLGGELGYAALLLLWIGTTRHVSRRPERDWS